MPVRVPLTEMLLHSLWGLVIGYLFAPLFWIAERRARRNERCLLELVADGEKVGDRKCPDNKWCEWPAGPCMKSYRPGTELNDIREGRER